MNINEFTKEYNERYGQKIDRRQMIDILTRNYQDYGVERELVIIMEELSELIQQVSKTYRHEEDPMHLLEEVADVYICLEQLRMVANITPDALDAAMLVKLNRIKERLRTTTSPKIDLHDFSGLVDE